MAPEVLKGKYGCEVDMWSCGVLLYHLVSGCLPFEGETDQELFDRIKECDWEFGMLSFKRVSKECKDLIRRLLKHNPKERYTA